MVWGEFAKPGQDGSVTLKYGVKIYRYYFKAENDKFVP